MKSEYLTENLLVVNHPLILHNLTILRDKNTHPEQFRNAAKRISQTLLINATDNIPLIKTTVETPLISTETQIIDPQSEIIVAPVLRAGLIISESSSDILPDAKVHHIGLYRNESTLEPVSYYNNLPKKFTNPHNVFVYILDPMLATGGSAVAAINLFIDLGISQTNIRFISLISAPEGINKLHSIFKDVKIITASIDKELNSCGYIVPGLGDAGDRTFNTIY
jgi:uracil phosphoribosyltransferase